jgi:signal transduction histidine kinase
MLRDRDLNAASVPKEVATEGHVPESGMAQAAVVSQRGILLEEVLRDLQTPVALLQLSLGVLEGDLASAAPDTRSALRDALRAGKRIQRYIDHFVTGQLLRDTSSRSIRAQTDLGALLRALVAEYEPAAIAQGCSLRCELLSPTPTLRSDETLLERLLQNVIESVLARCSRGAELVIVARGGSAAEVRVSLTAEPCSVEPDFAACEAIVRRLSGVVTWEAHSPTHSTWTIRLPSATL